MFNEFKQKYSNFLELTRAYSLPISMFTWFVAVCWSLFAHPFTYPKECGSYFAYAFASNDILNITLSFIAIICLHLGTNLLDDYIDLKREMKKGISLEEVVFAGAPQKALLIKNGTFKECCVVKIIASLYFIATLIGIYFTWLRGVEIIWIALFAAVLCLIYPFATKWRPGGIGEFVIAILFGPLLTYAVYFALTGETSRSLQLFSITLALFNVIVTHIHSLMDWEHDIVRGKRTLCTVFKTKENAVKTLCVLLALGYLNVVLLMVLKFVSPWFLLVLLTLPIARELVVSMNNYIYVRDVKLEPKWFLGPMEDWEHFCSINHHYFMYRFYLARNLGMSTCIIAGLVYYFTNVLI